MKVQVTILVWIVYAIAAVGSDAPLWGEYQSPKNLMEAEEDTEELLSKVHSLKQTRGKIGLVFLVEGTKIPKELYYTAAELSRNKIPFHILLQRPGKKLCRWKRQWVELVSKEGEFMARLQSEPSLARFGRPQVWSKGLWQNFLIRMRHFWGVPRGWYCFAFDYYFGKESGYRRDFWNQAGWIGVGAKLGAVSGLAAWISLQEKAASQPNLQEAQATLAAILLQVFWGHVTPANNRLYYDLGLGYRHDLARVEPKLRWTMAWMSIHSVLTSLAVQAAAMGPSSLVSSAGDFVATLSHTAVNSLLGVIAKLVPTKWLADLGKTEERTSRLKSGMVMFLNLMWGLSYQSLKWGHLFWGRVGEIDGVSNVFAWALPLLAISNIGYLYLQHLGHQKAHAKKRPWYARVWKRLKKDFGFFRRKTTPRTRWDIYAMQPDSCAALLFQGGASNTSRDK